MTGFRFPWHPMANKRQTVIGIIVHLFLLIALSVPVFIPIIRDRTIYTGGRFWFVLGLMWCPGVAGLATRLIFQKTLRGVGWRWGKWKYQWASYLIPLMYPAVVYGRARILQLVRTRYVGFNDRHLCEKLCELEGFSLGRETLRRLLRSAGIGSPRKRRAPRHRQRRLPRAREGEMLLLDASLHP
jgi:hypothetical protein